MNTLDASKRASEFEQSPRRVQDRTHRWIADAIYRRVFDGIEITHVDEQPPDQAIARALDNLGVDFYLTFPNGMMMAGQEKFLSFQCRQFRSITISEYSWSRCAAQIYFCGYLTADGQNFDPYVLLYWPTVITLTVRGLIEWKWRPSRTSYPAFWYAQFDTLPDDCVIARDHELGPEGSA